MTYDSSVISRSISDLQSIFELLENSVPRPIDTMVNGQPALRYQEQSIPQAVVLKLARYISGLSAAHLLLKHRFLQEQGVLQRTLDDILDDITFLTIQNRNGTNKLGRKYLKVFWQEEFEDGVEPINSNKPRFHISRAEIRKSISAAFTDEIRETGIKAGGILSQTYSGFVHAAAPHIMEMFDWTEARFSLSGSKDIHLISDHAQDFWNYIYRGFLCAGCAAVALNNTEVAQLADEARDRFEFSSGSSIMSRARHDQEMDTED